MKPQSLALAEYLNQGKTITRDGAWELFGIQNLTARLSELVSQGFAIIKETHKRCGLINGRDVSITHWKFRDTISPGDCVQIIKDTSTFVALKNRLGTIGTIDLGRAQACVFIPNVGYRNLRFSALVKNPFLAVGTKVTIKDLPLVVGDYHIGVNSYTLVSPNPEHTIVAHASLVERHGQI